MLLYIYGTCNWRLKHLYSKGKSLSTERLTHSPQRKQCASNRPLGPLRNKTSSQLEYNSPWYKTTKLSSHEWTWLKTFRLWRRSLTFKRYVIRHEWKKRYSILCSTRNSSQKASLKVSGHLVLWCYALRVMYSESPIFYLIENFKTWSWVPASWWRRVLLRVTRSHWRLSDFRSISSPNCGSDFGKAFFGSLFWRIWQVKPQSHLGSTNASKRKCHIDTEKDKLLQWIHRKDN